MSSFIFENGKIFSFKNYLLSESIKPKEIKYGINYPLYDNYIIKNVNNVYLTSFLFDEKIYTVIIDNENSVGFHFSEIPNKEKDYFDIISVDTSGKDARNNSSAIRVFSFVFFIILEFIEKYNLKMVKFDAAHKSLGIVYDKMVKNKFFYKEFQDRNFIFKGKIEDEYIFIKL